MSGSERKYEELFALHTAQRRGLEELVADLSEFAGTFRQAFQISLGLPEHFHDDDGKVSGRWVNLLRLEPSGETSVVKRQQLDTIEDGVLRFGLSVGLSDWVGNRPRKFLYAKCSVSRKKGQYHLAIEKADPKVFTLARPWDFSAPCEALFRQLHDHVSLDAEEYVIPSVRKAIGFL